MTIPYDHQWRAIEFIRDKPHAALFMEMGVGKTLTAIFDAVLKFKGTDKANNVLVVCPNSIKSTWVEEIAEHSGALNNDVHQYEDKKKFNKWSRNSKTPGSLNWLIVAVESLSQGGAFKEILTWAENNIGFTMVVDESSTIKGHKAQRTRNVIALSRFAGRRRILSGTPVAKGVEDLYTQYFFLDPNIIGCRSYFAFRNRYCVMGGWQGKQVVGYENLNDLMARLEPYTFRVTKAECLTLPDKVYEKRVVEMSPEQERVYRDMHKNLMAELEGASVTVTTALSKMLRLMQISGGFLPVEHDQGEGMGWIPKTIPGKNPKLEELMVIMEQAQGKVIIWCKFIAEIDLVSRALLGAKIPAAVVHGAVSEDSRTAARHAFQNDPNIRAYVGQPEAGGIGISLTAASTVIYYSNSYSSVSRIQSEDRAHRIGQKNNVTYIDLVCAKTIDEKVLKALRNKIDFANIVMGAIEKGTWEDVV